MIRSPGISRNIINRDNNEIIVSLDSFDPTLQPGGTLCVLANHAIDIKNIKLCFNLKNTKSS